MYKIILSSIIASLCSGCLMASAGFIDGSSGHNYINDGVYQIKKYAKEHPSEKMQQLETCLPDTEFDISTPCLKGVKIKECDLSMWDSATLYYSCVDDVMYNNFYLIVSAKSEGKVNNSQRYYMQVKKQ